jgi:light-regulated signal transduction histidine kinase (bacteriophytochrome)
MKPTKLDEVLREVTTNLEKVLEKNDAKVTWDPLPTVRANFQFMVQVFQNLIGNAIKYRKKDESPNIHITCQQRDGEWVIAVCDNGIGIEKQYQERVFGIYQRLHTNKEIPGTGIGLAICRKIIERHGGRIWLESTPGKGSNFFLTLPVKLE